MFEGVNMTYEHRILKTKHQCLQISSVCRRLGYPGAWAVPTDLSDMDCDLLRYNRTGQSPSNGLRNCSPCWSCCGWTVRNGDHSLFDA